VIDEKLDFICGNCDGVRFVPDGKGGKVLVLWPPNPEEKTIETELRERKQEEEKK
jgi:hypothetical protein